MESSNAFYDLLYKKEIRHIRLSIDHPIKDFDCGVQDLNDFLFTDSKVYLRHLRYTTFLLETSDKTIAYYSLANDLLQVPKIEDLEEEISKINNHNIEDDYWYKFFKQKMYPSAKIGRLAVDKEYQSLGVGTFIIDYLVHGFTTSNKTGCQFITIDAINDRKQQRAIRFYENHGFKFVTASDMGNDSRAMYKPLIDCLILKEELSKKNR